MGQRREIEIAEIERGAVEEDAVHGAGYLRATGNAGPAGRRQTWNIIDAPVPASLGSLPHVRTGLPRFSPVHVHGRAETTGILLVNLGTPDAPRRRHCAAISPSSWDRRVVEIPRPLWWLILHGIILRTRPA